MTKSKKVGSKNQQYSKSNSTLGNLKIAGMFLDTSLRVAIPILGLTIFGHWLDNKLQSSPVFLLIGFFASLLLTNFLIYRQLKSAFPDMFGGKK